MSTQWYESTAGPRRLIVVWVRDEAPKGARRVWQVRVITLTQLGNSCIGESPVIYQEEFPWGCDLPSEPTRLLSSAQAEKPETVQAGPRRQAGAGFTNGPIAPVLPQKAATCPSSPQHNLDETAYSPNTQPQQTVDWMTPPDKLTETLQ